jgi:hypothetical protein
LGVGSLGVERKNNRTSKSLLTEWDDFGYGLGRILLRYRRRGWLVMARILNSNLSNCVHFKKVMAKGCCGRRREANVCTIPGEDGVMRHKACFTEMPYCKFESKTLDEEEQN